MADAKFFFVTGIGKATELSNLYWRTKLQINLKGMHLIWKRNVQCKLHEAAFKIV